MLGPDVLEEDDGVLVRLSGQHLPEEGRTHAQHDLVRLEDAPAARQRHVRQHLVGAQLLHDVEERVVVVVPLQQELVPARAAHRGGLFRAFPLTRSCRSGRSEGTGGQKP